MVRVDGMARGCCRSAGSIYFAAKNALAGIGLFGRACFRRGLRPALFLASRRAEPSPQEADLPAIQFREATFAELTRAFSIIEGSSTNAQRSTKGPAFALRRNLEPKLAAARACPQIGAEFFAMIAR